MASSLDKAKAGWIPYYDSTGTKIQGYLDPSKGREFTAEERQHLQKMSALMTRIAELQAIQAAADRDIAAAEREIAEAKKGEQEAAKREADAAKREADAAKREADAAKREADAAKRESEAAKEELDAAAQCQDATKQLQAIEGIERRLVQLSQKIKEIQSLTKQADQHGAEARRLGAEADKASMLKALSIMVFPQFKTGSEATRAAEVKQARDLALSFSEKIVASHANRDWHVIRNKSPHLTALAIANLIKPMITDSRLPKGNGLTLDLSGFTDEIDIEPTAEFIKTTTHLKQITFGQLSDSQVITLAKSVAGIAQAKGPEFIKFTNEGTAAKFKEALSFSGASVKQTKPLPLIPPRPGKNPTSGAIPMATGGTNTPLVPNNGSPPKGQA